MQAITDIKLRKELFFILDQVGKTNIPITITRDNKKSIVLLSLKGYQAIEKIFELIDDPYQLYLDITKDENNIIT